MHELLLFGQVPATRHTQLLHILAGLSAMQPTAGTEHHVLFRPSSLPSSSNGPARVGGSQGVASQKTGAAAQAQGAQGGRNANTDVFYVKLVRDVKEGDGKEGCRFVFQETPVPGKRATILRSAVETEITGGEPQEWVEALGYTYQSASLVTTHQFILDNTILTLSRTHILPTSNSSITSPIPTNIKDLPLLDQSGTYLLEAKVRIAEPSPALIARAERELLAFKDRMKGVVDMVCPERLALDTRYLAVRPKLVVAEAKGPAQGGGGQQARPAGPVR